MTTDKHILIVDDDAAAREMLSIMVQEWGYRPLEAKDGEDALKKMEKDPVSVVVTDVIMPKLGGLELLRRLKVTNSSTKLILITAEGTIDLGVEAMKLGAVDFLTKPIDFKKLKILLDNLCEEEAEMVELDDLDKLLRSGGSFFGLIGRSPAIKSIVGLIRDVASKDAAVLITGESGTGKEVVANAIHQASPRALEPYIAIKEVVTGVAGVVTSALASSGV